ncbi:EamA family transporter [Rhizobium tubonense]|uniref:EamA family transporter n=1 Tax=Rhizobium tubonense TaxID=484088 RepID=A0A2W4CN14_9HYPH|nr:EamA family transporter [Rhizobium tubonense]PZM12288.1 EamA family transporter [Rhizobium tubonense]
MDDNAIVTGTDGGAALLPQSEVPPSSTGIAAGALMCLLSMSSIQFGAALSSSAIDAYGAVGATWLRLAFAAIILAVIVRPPVLRFSREQWVGALLLGTVTACMTMSFFAAIQRIPLGLLVAIDFLGPLSVAAFGYGIGWRLVWPLVAGIGVILLARDGQGWVGNLPGVLFAGCSAVGWAVYILLTKKVGAVFKGLEGLSMSLLVAALVATPFGISAAAGALTLKGLAEVMGLAILVPLLPYALEMIALRRMSTSSFGILMSLEPAMGAVAGFVILAQPMTSLQMLGTAFVMAASVGATLVAQRGG